VESGVNQEDRIIVDALRGGDRVAFEQLYDQHFRRIYGFAVRKLGDAAEAEDVVQEVFAAVFTCVGRFEGKSDLLVWIYGITRNLLNNRLRRRGGVRLISLDDLPLEAAPVDPGPGARCEARQTLEKIRAAIEDLPPEQRHILELRHGQRLAIRKIASLLGRSEDAIKSSLYRARRSLQASVPSAAV
jgi:RNA polymerase sigma-70 factor (ECF subfamily)